MADLSDQIAELEAEIERLSEAAERCRKIEVVARIASWAGGLVLVSMILGLLRFSPELLVISITAALGGVALRGTNRSTLDEVKHKITEAEERRSALIDAMRLHTVDAD